MSATITPVLPVAASFGKKVARKFLRHVDVSIRIPEYWRDVEGVFVRFLSDKHADMLSGGADKEVADAAIKAIAAAMSREYERRTGKKVLFHGPIENSLGHGEAGPHAVASSHFTDADR